MKKYFGKSDDTQNCERSNHFDMFGREILIKPANK